MTEASPGSRLTVVGLGPGRLDWCVPAVAERIAEATDLVGYGPYLDMVQSETQARRHASDNRVEADRAVHALDLASAGADVVVVSSGDPGIFAMASVIVEQLHRHPERWTDVQFEVLPGVSAAQSLASRVGAPLGHDFCIVSLSDIRKPWELVERRLSAAASADFVIALYNPASKKRPWQFRRACEVIGEHRDPDTTVIRGRDVGRPDEEVEVMTLKSVVDADIDMRTILIIGSSATVSLPERPLSARVYTPRTHEAEKSLDG